MAAAFPEARYPERMSGCSTLARAWKRPGSEQDSVARGRS